MPAIRDILCYPNLLPFETTEANVDAFMQTLKAAGITHVQINHLPDLMHPEQISQPDNVYLWFANFGPPLDLFVDSSLNRGIYPEMYLERNRRTLLRFADSAHRHGIKPLLYLCEPRFVPERFFQRHPTLRGPRVDNPNCSRTPLYALCTDLPEVREHYREMLAKVMELVPDLSLITLFTSDSGSGFDYNPETYAGANGAGFNRKFPLEKRVLRFLTLLLEEGRRKNPEFTVNLTSGFSPEERERILAAAPAGVVGSVYGLYDWEGGLEEQWGYHQAVWGVPKAKWNIRTLDRDAARVDRTTDMRKRFEIAATGGREPIVHAELPTTDYPRPLRYVPHPFEVIRLMKTLSEIGVKRLSAWGVISGADTVPQDVNVAAMNAANADIAAPADALVTAIAGKWVGRTHADALVRAWRECDQAWCRRPLWTLGWCKQAMPGPLVPDLTRLTPDEVAYYRTVAMDDLEQIAGLGFWIPVERDERNRDYVIETLYRNQTIPGLERAIATLETEAVTAVPVAAGILLRQRDHIRFALLFILGQRNLYEAGRHLTPGDHPTIERSLTEIIDSELDVTRQMIGMLKGRQNQFIRTMWSDFMTYEYGPGFTAHLEQRIRVMERHRNDPVRNLSDRLGKFHAYLKGMQE